MELFSTPRGNFRARSSFRRSDSDEVVIQVLANDVTIQVISDRVRIASTESTPLRENRVVVEHDDQNRVCKAVLKITSSIVAIVSAVVGFLDPSTVGFPLLQNKLAVKGCYLVVKGCYLAVMVCFCFCLGLLMLSEVVQRSPISVPMAKKLKLLVLTLVQLAVAMKTVSLFMEL